MKFEAIKAFLCAHKKDILVFSLTFIPVFIVFIISFKFIANASFGVWGDSSLIHGCETSRGQITLVSPSDSCNTGETEVTWLKDVDAGDGLTITRSSSGATLALANTGGWINADETWTYASSDAPTFTFTVPGDDTGKYSPGMRVKLTQTTTKYFLITAVSYTSPNTTVTLYGGTDYSLADATISNPYFSSEKAPQGFPLDPSKWTVEITDAEDRTVASPNTQTWYNPDPSLQIEVPIGIWTLEYLARPGAMSDSASWAYSRITLSTSDNSESDPQMTGIAGMDAATGTLQSYASLYRSRIVNLTGKTTYYLDVWGNSSTGSLSALRIRGADSMTIIRAISTYL